MMIIAPYNALDTVFGELITTQMAQHKFTDHWVLESK